VPPGRKRSQSSGPITRGAKRAGQRSAGNPHAPFDRAGAGDGLTATLNGHEAGNGGDSQGEPNGVPRQSRPYHPANIKPTALPVRYMTGEGSPAFPAR